MVSSNNFGKKPTVIVASQNYNSSEFTEEMHNSDYSNNEAQHDNAGLDGKCDEQNRRVPYTMHGVLHFLQHEWSKYEMERAQWEMERAELQARISFLQGERKGQENLKADLIRRIKMLEYSLNQERAKNYRLTHNGQDRPDGEIVDQQDSINPTLHDVDAYAPQCNSAASFRNARALLRQYLSEIGYSETILDVRAFRTKNLLEMIPNSEGPNSDSNRFSRQQASKVPQETDRAIDTANYTHKNNAGGPVSHGSDESDSEDDEKQTKGVGKKDGLDPETVNALGEFSFLKEEKIGTVERMRSESSTGEWGVNQRTIDQMKEKFRNEQERKRSNSQSDNAPGKITSTQKRESVEGAKKELLAGEMQLLFGNKSRREFVDINSALGIVDDNNVDIKDDFIVQDEETASIRWNLKFTLRSHFDAVRVMQFHPVEPVLITASEDGTAKLWNLGGTLAKQDSKTGQTASHSTILTELEPIYTFRGHDGAILSMDMSPTGDMCYTGGLDGLICCWSVPSVTTDIYELYDAKILTEKLKGHSDAVWSVVYHSSDNRLVSASADTTIKLWEPGSSEKLVKTYSSISPHLCPTSVDFVSTEPQHLLIAYSTSHASIIDLETSQTVLTFNFNDENPGTITKILSHPTMPVTLTASADRKIRYFDNCTGKVIHEAVAHVEAISSLAVDPNGLYLLSGSHDGSLRLWNMEKRICLQEIAAHRKKFDHGVLTVAFHPSRPLIGSAGADSLSKVFSSQKYSVANNPE